MITKEWKDRGGNQMRFLRTTLAAPIPVNSPNPTACVVSTGLTQHKTMMVSGEKLRLQVFVEHPQQDYWETQKEWLILPGIKTGKIYNGGKQIGVNITNPEFIIERESSNLPPE